MTLTRPFAPLSLLTSMVHTLADKRYQHLREQLGQALFLVAPRTGVILDMNHKAVEFTGYSRDELQSLSLSELIPAREGASALEQIRSLKPGAIRTIERVPLCTRAGRIALADLRASFAGEESEPVVLLLARDAERRAKVSDAMARRSQSLAALDALSALLLHPSADTIDSAVGLCRDFLNADVAGLYRVMTDTDTPGLQLISVCDLPGDFPLRLGAGDVAAVPMPVAWRTGERPDSALTRAARSAGLGALYTHPLGDDTASSGLLIIGHKINTVVPHETPVMVGIAARYLTALIVNLVRSHVSEMQQLEAAYLGQRLDAVMTEASDGVIMVDANGDVTRLNAAAEHMLGFHEGEVVGTGLEDVVVASRPVASALLAALRTGRRYGGRDVSLVRRDGREMQVLLRATPVIDSANQVTGGLVFLSDRTEHKTFEAQSQHLAQRAFLGDMSAIFAHEVRNPLNGISTGLQYIAMKAPTDDPLRGSVGKMLAEVNRIEQLLKNILLVAKPTEIRVEPTDISALLQRLLQRWGPRIERHNIESKISIETGVPLVMADSNQMEQVFTNLITNAAQAMGREGGTIAVKVQPANGLRPRFGNYVQIEVSDTGPGIPADKLDRIFDPFYTTRAEGNGLGLAIAQRIIHAHRGKIEVQSWTAVGTVFSVYLPIAPHA